jgi:glyoxylase-like metal-dependent hydrolase (beta-lactamase superfamily II)
LRTISVGTVRVSALVDAVQAYPAAAVYPRGGDIVERYRGLLDENGAVVLNFASFLVHDGARTVLVDTGWGPEHGGQLLAELAAAGATAGDVDTVIFTHLHGDHTGWNLDRASGKPLFPRARYLAPRADWDHYSAQDPKPASFVRDMLPLESAGQLDLLSGEVVLSPSLVAVPTPGHTPGHTSVAITSGGEHGFILGDVVISPIDPQEPELENVFDWDSAIAGATRRRTLPELAANRAMVGASHLPPPGLGRFVELDRRYAWAPLGAV